MASSVSTSKSVFSVSVIRPMLCLKKFSHKALRNSNINTSKENTQNEFDLGTMLPSCQRRRFAMRVNRDCNCCSSVSFQEILSSTSPPIPPRSSCSSPARWCREALNVPPRGSLADGRVTYNHSH